MVLDLCDLMNLAYKPIEFSVNSRRIQRTNPINSISVMNRTYKKSELAELADVSYSTFYRFLRTRREALAQLGSPLKAHTLRGEALEYVCRNYNITLPPEDPAPPKKHIKFC